MDHTVEAVDERLFRLDGRVALVTGATGHLGRSMAAGLAEAGAHVVLNSRNVEDLAALEATFKGRGLSVSTAAFDVTESASIAAGVSMIHERHSRIDVLVNNAYDGRPGTLENATEDDFLRSYDVVVVAAHRTLTAAMPALLQAVTLGGYASVINIGSMYGSVSPDPSIYKDSGMNNPPYYGAAKAALVQFTRYAACHLARSGIRVNAISPGPFPAVSQHPRSREFIDRLSSRVPLRRVGQPDELKGTVVFLASPASSYVTGANIPVDGGWTAW